MAKKQPGQNPQLLKPKPAPATPPTSAAMSIGTWLPRLLWPVYILYALLVIYGMTNHEPWRDEAQSWLVVKNLDLAGLFKKLPSEGHPPTWYLVLFPFAKLGAPYVIQNILSAAFMIAGIYLLLFRSKLPILLKLILPFTYLFLFEYALVGRSYCVLVFLMSAILALYPQRFQKPWLFALCVVAMFNTHMLIFSFCFTLSCIYLLDAVQQKKINTTIIAAFAFMVIGGLYLIPYMGSSKVTGAFHPYLQDHFGIIKRTLALGLLAGNNGDLAIILLILLCATLITRTKPFLLMIGGLAAVVYIIGYIFPGDIRHGGVAFIIITGIYGLYDFYKDDNWNIIAAGKFAIAKYSYLIFALMAILQIKPAIENYLLDNEQLYSDSQNAASYIKEHHLENNIIVGQSAWATSAILPYLQEHKELYYVECQRFGSYYVFDTCFTKGNWGNTADSYVDIANNNFKGKTDKLLFVFNSPLSPVWASRLDLLYSSQEQPIKQDEVYFIYRFKNPSR